MADNTVLPTGGGGDTVRDLDKGAGVKTQVVVIDLGGAGAENLLTGTLPVSVAGVATAAGQAIETAVLSSIDAKIVAVDTGAVTVSSSALPAGAATGAKQDTGNASLASLDGKTPALGQAVAASSTPVVLTAAQVTTLTPPAAIVGFALEAGHVANIDAAIGAAADVAGVSTVIGQLKQLIADQPALGQQAMADSIPVTIASDQSGLRISAASFTAQVVDQNQQIIKLLGAILQTLGKNGNGFIDPEEGTELSILH